jgi:hypothetical protein
MSKRSRKALWEYLKSTGALNTGDEAVIKVAKQAYRKQYLLEFKRRQRQSKHEFNVTFSNANGEYDRIAQGARRHKMSVTSFVRKAALAYLDRTFVVPNAMQVAKLEQVLSDCLNEVKTIVRAREKFFWERERKLDALERCIARMEEKIDEALRRPTMQTDDRQNQIA